MKNRFNSLPITLLAISSLVFTFNLSAQQIANEWDAFDAWEEEAVEPALFTGFVEMAAGRRLQSDPVISTHSSLGEIRGRVEYQHAFSHSQFKATSDLELNDVTDEIRLHIRELFWQGNLSFLGAWGQNLDLKTGHQILTWGTGDYLFLNDLFAKDYQSFFNGREDEFLKAPSTSIKLSGYFPLINVDLVITPEFTADQSINGEYFSFFHPQLQQNVAPEFSVTDHNQPDGTELAVRLFKSFHTAEFALYGYDGYFKSPTAADKSGLPRHSELQVWGASLVQPMAAGLIKVEFAYHDSEEDDDGNNPLIPNSQSRYLIGYEQELISNLAGGLQFYVEQTHDYENLKRYSPWPQYEQEEYRQVVTTQLIYRAKRQTLTLNWFNFYSPTANDGYSRVNIAYSPVNEWKVSGGINLFYGDAPHSFFSQFKDGSNAFIRFRYFY